MAKFKEAFEQGLQAYAVVQRTRNEIYSIFDEMQSQITSNFNQLSIELITGKKEIPRKRETVIEGPSILEAASSLGSSLGTRKRTVIPEPEYRNYKAIKISLKEQKQTGVEICEYELSPGGYPVILRYADQYEHCIDKLSLETALEHMLANPAIGEKIQKVLTQHQT